MTILKVSYIMSFNQDTIDHSSLDSMFIACGNLLVYEADIHKLLSNDLAKSL